MPRHRAYLEHARIGTGLAALQAETARILRHLTATGATLVEPAALQPAAVLLDLYGEDIRARAFITGDDAAELMLRPDFTVPIVRLHLDGPRGPARYAYAGPVWRRQDAGSIRAREYLQAGVEVFDDAGTDPAASDAEVLALIASALEGAPVDLVTGDMGLVRAAVDALATTPARKAALVRHLWRPARFHALLLEFGADHAARTRARETLLDAGPERLAEAVPVGLRGPDEITTRLDALAREAETTPIDADAVARLEALLALTGPASQALGELRRLAREIAGLDAAIDRFAARLDALAARGIAPDTLRFEASFGRTTLEYYDGFVFGAVARARPDLPPIASGGRYDALTERLGGSRLPAVGGIIRPEALVALCGARA